MREVEKYLGRSIDTILWNDSKLPEDIVEKYKLQNDFPVIDDMTNDLRVKKSDFLATETIPQVSGDVISRSLIRHDGGKVANFSLKVLVN